MLKKLLPLLLLAKVKIGALATLAYFGIALLAKKAIVVSLISIAISAFLGLKSLWASKSGGGGGGHGHDTTGYSSGWASNSGASAGWAAPSSSGGWSSGGSGWDDGHSAQSQAFSGYHH